MSVTSVTIIKGPESPFLGSTSAYSSLPYTLARKISRACHLFPSYFVVSIFPTPNMLLILENPKTFI